MTSVAVQILLFVGIIFLGIMIPLFAINVARQMRKLIYTNESRLDEMTKEIRRLQGYFAEPVNKLFELEQRFRRLTERFEQLEMREKGDKQFERAAGLLNKGSSINDIMDTCGLTQGEVELLKVMRDMESKEQAAVGKKRIL